MRNKPPAITPHVPLAAQASAEIKDLLELAARMIDHAPSSARALRHWQKKATAAAADADTAAVEALISELRQRWLLHASQVANAHFRSPLEGDRPRLPSGAPVAFGYERELDPARFEAKADRFVGAPDDAQGRHLIFSSGQSALAALLTAAAARLETPRALSVAHLGGYFETAELAELMGAKLLQVDERDRRLSEADILIIEPVYLRSQFRAIDPAMLAATLSRHGTPKLVLVDATLSHLRLPISTIGGAIPCASQCTLLRISSLMKLDQAGLELATSGLLSIFSNNDLFETLSQVRAKTGGSVGFADVCALDLPFLFDPMAASAYSDAVFDHNARLAKALSGGVWQVMHPVLNCPPWRWSVAPYVVLSKCNGSVGECRALAARLGAATAAAGLPLRQGGSFGFRLHRFDIVEPKTSPPFIRIAMGASPFAVSEVIELVRATLSAQVAQDEG